MSALAFSVFPVSIRFSLAQAAENPNLLFQIAAFSAVTINIRKHTLLSFILTIVSCSILIFTRIYNIAFVALLLGFRLYFTLRYDESLSARNTPAKRATALAKAIFKRLIRPRNAIAAVFMASVTLCFALFFFNTVTTTAQSQHIHSPHHIYINLIQNSFFMIKNNGMPIALVLFSILGISSLDLRKVQLQHKRSFILFFTAWFLIYFACHLMSAVGGYDFDFYNDTIRYTIDFAVPLISLACIGIYAAYILLPKTAGRIFLCLTVLLISATPALYSRAINYDTFFTNILKTITLRIQNFIQTNTQYMERCITITARTSDTQQILIRKNGNAGLPKHASLFCNQTVAHISGANRRKFIRSVIRNISSLHTSSLIVR
jgi:hypothetical protein